MASKTKKERRAQTWTKDKCSQGQHLCRKHLMASLLARIRYTQTDHIPHGQWKNSDKINWWTWRNLRETTKPSSLANAYMHDSKCCSTSNRNGKVTCSNMQLRLWALAFQNSTSTYGVGFNPSSNGCAESFFSTARIWCVHSMTTVSTSCTTALPDGPALRVHTWRPYTQWAKKVSCCIAGCNFVNYGPI